MEDWFGYGKLNIFVMFVLLLMNEQQ